MENQLKIDEQTVKPKRQYNRKSLVSKGKDSTQITYTAPVQADNTPDGMIRMALQSGRSMDEIGQLIKFRNDEIARLSRLEFFAAKTKFTGLRKRIVKTREADYGTNDRGRQGAKYKFEDLDIIEEGVKDLVAECGFTYDWKTEYKDDWMYITCILTHLSGHFETDTMRGKPDTSGGKNSIQADASTTSYLMRYTLKKVLGMSTGQDDNDGKGGAPVPKSTAKNSKFKFEDVMKAVTAKTITFESAVNTFQLTDEQMEALKIAAESL